MVLPNSHGRGCRREEVRQLHERAGRPKSRPGGRVSAIGLTTVSEVAAIRGKPVSLLRRDKYPIILIGIIDLVPTG